jgi:hypothetical protein
MRGCLLLHLALCCSLFAPLVFEAHFYLHCPNTRDGTQCLFCGLLYLRGHLLLVGGHLDANVNILPVDLHAFDEPEGDDIAGITWIFDGF